MRYVAPGWEGPWVAELDGYTSLAAPITAFTIDGHSWTGRSVIEVAWAAYDAAVGDGAGPTTSEVPANVPLEADDAVEPTTIDPAGDVIAQRVVDDFPVEPSANGLSVPADLPTGDLPALTPKRPGYRADEDRVVSLDADVPRRSQNRARDRIAEQRAVQIAVAELGATGWTLTRDRQKDGVGYDLDFTRADEMLHVEVKGIQGSLLTFNLTAKELWRAESDPRWLVVAVTSVLSPTAYQAHVVTRDRITASRLVITGYRVRV